MRRTFSRSEHRRKILDAAQVKDYADPSRKRVTRWGRCAKCHKVEASYKLEVDHIDPVVPLDTSADEMSLDELADRHWCDERKLQALCDDCHNSKTKDENAERRRLKKERK